MDAKITKKRLGLLLSYDWLKIVGICVAAVLVWTLLFTMIATRPTSGQSFDMYFYPGVRLGSSVSAETLHKRDENDVLSYDVLNVSSVSLTTDTMATILQAHFAAGQGDVFFAPYIAPTTDEKTGEITAYNGLDAIIGGYYGAALWLGEDGQALTDPESGETKSNYFSDCEKYLDRFFEGGWENGTLDEQKVRENFDERMQGDKRYKNEAQREVGRQKEIVRISNLRDAYARVKGWISSADETSPVRVRTTTLELDSNNDGTTEQVEWQYAFDLSNIDDLADFVAYAEEGGTYTAEGMCMIVLSTGSAGEEDLRYEPFLLLDYLVKKYAPEKYGA